MSPNLLSLEYYQIFKITQGVRTGLPAAFQNPRPIHRNDSRLRGCQISTNLIYSLEKWTAQTDIIMLLVFL